MLQKKLIKYDTNSNWHETSNLSVYVPSLIILLFKNRIICPREKHTCLNKFSFLANKCVWHWRGFSRFFFPPPRVLENVHCYLLFLCLFSQENFLNFIKKFLDIYIYQEKNTLTGELLCFRLTSSTHTNVSLFLCFSRLRFYSYQSCLH